jgi:hypothetical protein
MDKQSVNTARTFLDITTKISEHQSAIKGLRQNLKSINTTLMGTMKDKSLDVIETNNGKICYVENMVKKGFTLKNITSLLEAYKQTTQTPINIPEIIQFLESNREVSVRENIKYKKK